MRSDAAHEQAQAAASVGALNGVLTASAYRAQLEHAGLVDVTITVTQQAALSISAAIIQASRRNAGSAVQR